jgi:nucleotide-binding universal stress UspA family protein
MISPLAYALPERVLVGYDGSKLSLRALHVAADLAEGLELPAVVASVDDDLEAADRLASEGAEYLVTRGISVQTHASKGDPAARLSELQEASDILALGGFGRGPVREFLLGSTTEYLLRHALGPVLLVR